MRPPLAILVVLIVVAALLPAQTRTSLGDLSFQAPAGWSVTRDAGTVKLMPGDLRSGSRCLVILQAPEAISGDLGSWFDGKWQAVLRIGSKVVQSNQPQHQASTHSEKDAIFASAVLQDAEQHKVWVILFGIRAGQKAFQLLWMTNDEQLLRSYQPAVQQLMASLKVQAASVDGGTASDGAAGADTGAADGGPRRSHGTLRSGASVPPDKAPPRGRLSGVYAGFYMGYGPGSSGSFELRTFVFYPDGTAMYLPEEGLDGYDLEAQIRGGLDTLMYGKYEFHQDGRLRYTAQNGVYRDLIIDTSADEPGLHYARVCHCNDFRFSGTYYWGNKTQTISFFPDGRFVDRGAIHEAYEYNFPDNPHMTDPGVGTYRIADYTIDLNYADGRRIRRSFVVQAHPKSSPDSMWFGGTGFHLVGGTR